MKFVSKNSNYLLVLRQGVSENKHLGIPLVPGLYVKFESNVAKVESEEAIELMKKHKGYGTSFVIAEENKDWEEGSSEPQHIISEVKHGNVGKTIGGGNAKLSPAIQKAIQAAATKLAVEMAPALAMEIVKGLADKQKADKAEVLVGDKEEASSEATVVKTTSEPLGDSESGEAVKEEPKVSATVDAIPVAISDSVDKPEVVEKINKTSEVVDSNEKSEEEDASK